MKTTSGESSGSPQLNWRMSVLSLTLALLSLWIASRTESPSSETFLAMSGLAFLLFCHLQRGAWQRALDLLRIVDPRDFGAVLDRLRDIEIYLESPPDDQVDTRRVIDYSSGTPKKQQ